MKNPWNSLRHYFLHNLWIPDRSSLTRPRALLLDTKRLLVVLVNDLLYGQISLWAMGLVYTTLMSMVPLLAVSFSVLKAFGVQNALEPFLLDIMSPLGKNGAELANKIIEFVNKMEVGVLGTVGLGLLIYTVMSLIQKVEEAFNTVWRVRGIRSIASRFSDYLSVVLVGPVLVVSSLALTASFMSAAFMQKIISIQPFGIIVAQAGKLIPYVLVCFSFTFLYMFIPNTRVRLGPALAGGVIAGVLWESIGWGFASFIVSSTRYAAIYSSFAILILFLIWVHLSWLILLVGAEVTFYYQNPQLLAIETRAQFPNARLIEQTTVSVMFLICCNYYHNDPPWTADGLMRRLGVGVGTFDDIMTALKQNHLIIETTGSPPAYVPARDIETIRLQDVYDIVRRPDTPDGSGRKSIIPVETVSGLIGEVDQAINNTLKSRSFKDLVRSKNS